MYVFNAIRDSGKRALVLGIGFLLGGTIAGTYKEVHRRDEVYELRQQLDYELVKAKKVQDFSDKLVGLLKNADEVNGQLAAALKKPLAHGKFEIKPSGAPFDK